MRLKLRLLLSLVLLAAASAQAATVYLKDGGSLRGTIVSATARDVTIHTGEGLRTVETERIARVDYADTAAPPPTPAVPERIEYREPVSSQEVSLNLGLTVPLDRRDFSSLGGGSVSDGSVGPHAGINYMASASRRLWAGVAFEYVGRTRTGSTGGVPLAITDVSGDTIMFLGTVKYVLRPGRDVRPYARLGLGPHRTTTVVDVAPQGGFVWADTQTSETRRLVDTARWGAAIVSGLGIDLAWAEPSFFGIEISWTGLSGASHEPAPAGTALGLTGGKSMLDILTVSTRFGWRF